MKNINDDHSLKATFSLKGWFKRGQLFREMYSLDDRMLADVGILRSDIGSIVEKSYPRISVLSVLAGLLDKLAESRKNHEIARELASFDDRLLADMGLYRSDVSSIAKGHYPHRHVHASPLRAYGTRIDSMTDAVNDDQKRAA